MQTTTTNDKRRFMKQLRLFSDILDAKLAMLQAEAAWNCKDAQRHIYETARRSLTAKSASAAIEDAYKAWLASTESGIEDCEAAGNVWCAARDAASAVEINYSDIIANAHERFAGIGH